MSMATTAENDIDESTSTPRMRAFASVQRPLTIAVLQDRYPTKFNIPKPSRHNIRPSKFLPLNLMSPRLQGITLLAPGRCDLVHTVNRIPIATKQKFVISFESHLPLFFGGERSRFFAYLRRKLAGPTCRRIIAYSEFAKKNFLAMHTGTEEYDELAAKLTVVYPNIVLPSCEIDTTPRQGPLKLVFVGAHFGRKGGAVAARAAEIARNRRMPIHFHIISSLKAGQGVWSDPHDDNFFLPYFDLLKAENVTFDHGLPNERVIEIMRAADFSLLTTLSDTFGFSAVESLAVGTPVIATPVGALPEFVVDGCNGILIPLDIDRYGEWIHIGRLKDSKRFEALYRDEIERMAHAVVDSVVPYCDNPSRLLAMRQNSRMSAERLFDSRKTGPVLDMIYEESVFAP